MNEYNEFDLNNERMILTDTKQKKKSRALKIAAGAAAAVTAVGAVSAAASPEVRNTAKMAFSSPGNYFAGVLRGEALSRSEKLAELYVKYCDASSAGISESGNVTISLGKEIADDFKIPVDTKLDFDYSVSAKDRSASGTLGFSADGVNIIDFTAINSKESLYFSVPTISSAWLTITSDELTEAANDIFFGSYYRTMYDDEENEKKDDLPKEITVLDGTVLTRERTDRIFTKYTDIFLKHTDGVKLSKNKELTSKSGITVKYTEAALSFTSEDLYDIISDMITVAKNDDDLRAVWTSLGYTSEDYDDMISKREEALGEKDDASRGSADIILYIGSDGKIKGEKIVSSSGDENDNDALETSAVFYAKGKDFSFEALGTSSSFYSNADEAAYISYSSRSDNEYALTLSGTYSGGKITGGGKFELTEKGAYNYSDEPVSDDYDYTGTLAFDIDFSDIDVKSLEKGEPEGRISISGGSDDGAAADITFNASGRSADCTMDFREDNEKIFSMEISAGRSEYSAPEVPAENVFRITGDEDDLRKYLLTSDTAKFRENVEKARASLGDPIADSLLGFAEDIEGERAMLAE